VGGEPGVTGVTVEHLLINNRREAGDVTVLLPASVPRANIVQETAARDRSALNQNVPRTGNVMVSLVARKQTRVDPVELVQLQLQLQPHLILNLKNVPTTGNVLRGLVALIKSVANVNHL
jgi:hypothetical protein